ncbi:MAG: hypothetical protein J0H42_04045 [Rhizobiales bacterium]|nr:hypothetical protein [Hyphomicrobiales bacterium]
MIVYPVPVEVTQARIQLLVDQTAKAPPNTINEDLNAVYDAKSQAQQAQVKEHVQRHVDQHAEPHVDQHAETGPTALIDVKV